MIFETERLLIRKLQLIDLTGFHELESNPNVLKFADGEVKTFHQNKKELLDLIAKYALFENDFWIYAIERKSDKQFLGTLAFVKNGKEDEIGYRFLEKFWKKGYGLELCKATVNYCKQLGLKKIIAYVVDKNIASVKIIKKNNFKVVDHLVNEKHQKETKYCLEL